MQTYAHPYEVVRARAERGEILPLVEVLRVFDADAETVAASTRLRADCAARGADPTHDELATALNVPRSFVPLLLCAYAAAAMDDREACIGILGAERKAAH